MLILQLILILISVLLIILLWILLAPFYLYVNTDEGVYYVKLSGMAKAQLHYKEDAVRIKLRIFFFRTYIDPFKPVKKKKRKVPKDKPKSSGRKGRSQLSAGGKFMQKILYSFNIRQCNVDLDTGNFLYNAWLFPLTLFIEHRNLDISVNFSGRNVAIIKIQNRLIKLFVIFLGFYISR